MDIYEQQRPKSVPPQLPPGLIKKIVIGLIALVVVIIGSSMFYTVQEQQRAAILTFGKYTGETGAGLHFKLPYPLQQVIKVEANRRQVVTIGYRESNGQITPVEAEALMITGDENIVSADAVVEWRISNVEDYLFNIDDPQKFLRNAATASIRTVMGSTNLDFAITEGKTEIQGKVKDNLVDLLQNSYHTGIQILDFKFQDIEPPAGDVEQAFREVTNAREEKNTKINNANKYMNDRLPKARGEAQAKLEQAAGEKQSRILNAQGDVAKFNAIYSEYVKSPQVTKERLVIETLEKVLPGAKIFVTDGSGETVKYLPLNELLKGTGSAGSAGSVGQSAGQGGGQK